jgi:hypothetical protein
MKIKEKKGSIHVELTVLYYPYTTRPEACYERCPQFSPAYGSSLTGCTVYGKLETQRMPGRARYTRAAGCIEAERTTAGGS